MSLGATHVATYDDLSQRSFQNTVKEWTGGKVLSPTFVPQLIYS